MSYQNELRDRVLAPTRSGERCRSLSVRWVGAPSMVVELAGRTRWTGWVRPAEIGGDRLRNLDPRRDRSLDQVRNRAPVTLTPLQALSAKRGVPVGCDTLWRPLHGCGFSLKKDACRRRTRARRLNAPANAGRVIGAGSAQRGRSFRSRSSCHANRVPASGGVWLRTGPEPLRGWAPKGDCLQVRTSLGHRIPRSFRSPPSRPERCPCVLDGPANGSAASLRRSAAATS